MKLNEVEVIARERFGDHALLRYRWPGRVPEPGQFVMVRTSTQSLDPFLPRPLFAHDYEDGEMSLLFKIRGRGTTLLAEEDARLLVSGPLGRGFQTGGGELVALLGGGVWVSPLKLLGRSLDKEGVASDTFLEIPATAPEAYAAWISESYPDATLVPTKGTSDPSRAILNRLGDLERYASLFASGPV